MFGHIAEGLLFLLVHLAMNLLHDLGLCNGVLLVNSVLIYKTDVVL